MVALAFYLASIIGTNLAFIHLGVVNVGFGYLAPAGALFVGLSLILRDLVQDRLGRMAVVVAILVGAGVTAFLSPALALASGVAFVLSEAADFAVYTPLRERGRKRAMLASNAVGLVADSVVFLWLAFGSLAFLPGQILAKTYSTLAAVAVVALAERLPRLRLKRNDGGSTTVDRGNRGIDAD